MKRTLQLVLFASLCTLLGTCIGSTDNIAKPTDPMPETTPHSEASPDVSTTDAVEAVTRVPISTPSSTSTASPTPTISSSPTVIPSSTFTVDSLETVSTWVHKAHVRLFRSMVNPAESRLDLDTGQVTGPENLAADIEFYTSVGTIEFDFVKTVNGAKAQQYSRLMFGYEDCQEYQAELVPNMIAQYSVGTICVLTNQGRLSSMRFGRYGEEWIEFHFTTWDKISSTSSIPQ